MFTEPLLVSGNGRLVAFEKGPPADAMDRHELRPAEQLQMAADSGLRHAQLLGQ